MDRGDGEGERVSNERKTEYSRENMQALEHNGKQTQQTEAGQYASAKRKVDQTQNGMQQARYCLMDDVDQVRWKVLVNRSVGFQCI